MCTALHLLETQTWLFNSKEWSSFNFKYAKYTWLLVLVFTPQRTDIKALTGSICLDSYQHVFLLRLHQETTLSLECHGMRCTATMRPAQTHAFQEFPDVRLPHTLQCFPKAQLLFPRSAAHTTWCHNVGHQDASVVFVNIVLKHLGRYWKSIGFKLPNPESFLKVLPYTTCLACSEKSLTELGFNPDIPSSSLLNL